jgi:hypothetical protein
VQDMHGCVQGQGSQVVCVHVCACVCVLEI